MEYQVKVWKPLLLTWHKRTLIIKDNIFQIIRDKFGKRTDRFEKSVKYFLNF